MRTTKMTMLGCVLGFSMLGTTGASAAVSVPPVFGDHMVLQQESACPVWGWAAPGEKVTVTVGSATVTTQADGGGKWRVNLEKLKASSSSAELTIAGATNTITIKDVLVGDVWLASGQSNMGFGMATASNAGEELPKANRPEIRFLKVRTRPALEPQSTCEARWEVCTPETAKGVSAVGYHFIRELADTRKVPMGLLCVYQGATPAEAWTSLEGLQADPDLAKGYAEPFLQTRSNLDAVKQVHDAWLAAGGSEYRAALMKYHMESFQARQKGLPEPARPKPPAEPEPQDPNSQTLPTVLYNGMVAPLAPFAIKGAIWYQGESNSGKFVLYRKLFPAMIADWRKQWGQGDFPFLYVQLPNYGERKAAPDGGDGGWPSLRETQMQSLRTVPATGMAVTLDVGDGKDLHPPFKAPVGHRLALAARHVAYGEDLLFSGPIYKSHRVEGGQVLVTFSHVGQGLKSAQPPAPPAGTAVTPVDELKGFAIAGADLKFVWAAAKIEGPDTVRVWSDAVKAPAAVRYGWGSNPDVNLYNSGDLPASPFRTE